MDRTTRFLHACRRQTVDRPPLWIMRQAGRYLPEYLALREKHDFLEVCHTPELAAEATLQPLRRFGFDAGIIFSDILIVPEAMGMTLEFPQGGPLLSPGLKSSQDLDRLREVDAAQALSFIGEAIEIVREKDGEQTPILGFAGAPFTLACYMLEKSGWEHHFALRIAAARDPEFYHGLMERLTQVVIDLLSLQIRAGAAAVQLFDTWAGQLQPTDYRELVQPYHRKIFEALKPLGVPLILFVKDGSGVLEQMADSGADVLGIDWRQNLALARERVGDAVALQGNLDPALLYGPKERIAAEVSRIHKETGGVGHIFNLGHGIRPDAPLDAVTALVEAVQSLSNEA